MRRVRPNDGTDVHLRAGRYHRSRCMRGKTPLHAQLAAEMGSRLTALITAQRGAQDAEGAEVEASAAADAAELDVENAIRELDGELAKVDRKDPSVGAQAAVFPNGYGADIDPEGDAQIDALNGLYVRVKPFVGHTAVADAVAALKSAEKELSDALAAESAAAAATDTAFAEELAARAALRQQFESAYGLLRSHYKARPALAETFFMKESGRRRKKEEPAGGGSGGSPG